MALTKSLPMLKTGSLIWWSRAWGFVVPYTSWQEKYWWISGRFRSIKYLTYSEIHFGSCECKSSKARNSNTFATHKLFGNVRAKCTPNVTQLLLIYLSSKFSLKGLLDHHCTIGSTSKQTHTRVIMSSNSLSVKISYFLHFFWDKQLSVHLFCCSCC